MTPVRDHVPVSYTHLDVYKRQIPCRRIGRQAGQAIVFQGTRLAAFVIDRKRPFRLAEKPMHGGDGFAGQVTHCLLYTSRCV